MAQPAVRRTVFYGTVIHSLSLSNIQVVRNALLAVENETGVILALAQSPVELIAAVPDIGLDALQWNDLLQSATRPQEEVIVPGQLRLIRLGRRLLIPGFVDTHAHAPQYVFTGTGRIPLLQWLETFTFPTEAKFSDKSFANDAYFRAVSRHLRNGTTTCCYYGTIHLDATLVLVDIVSRLGQRAFVGKVCMDANSPPFYVETTAESSENTRKFIQQVRAGNNPLVTPIITPRFAPSCTSELMKSLAKIADEHKLPIQSHISENLEEVEWVKSLFPDCHGYADVYLQHGLLNDRTIMAHCIHLTPEEIQLFKRQDVGVAHCANSNFTLHSGVCDVRKLLREGIKVGLGTDVSGGYSASMLDAIRQTILAARTIEFDARLVTDAAEKKASTTPFDWHEAFYLATMGGAQLVGMADRIGNFQAGKLFDALVVDAEAPNSPIDIFPADDVLDVFQKFIFLGDDRNITSIYVNGVDRLPLRRAANLANPVQ